MTDLVNQRLKHLEEEGKTNNQHLFKVTHLLTHVENLVPGGAIARFVVNADYQVEYYGLNKLPDAEIPKKIDGTPNVDPETFQRQEASATIEANSIIAQARAEADAIIREAEAKARAQANAEAKAQGKPKAPVPTQAAKSKASIQAETKSSESETSEEEKSADGDSALDSEEGANK